MKLKQKKNVFLFLLTDQQSQYLRKKKTFISVIFFYQREYVIYGPNYLFCYIFLFSGHREPILFIISFTTCLCFAFAGVICICIQFDSVVLNYLYNLSTDWQANDCSILFESGLAEIIPCVTLIA